MLMPYYITTTAPVNTADEISFANNHLTLLNTLDAAFRQLEPFEFKVYFYLAQLFGESGIVCLSVEDISKACGCNRKTVTRALKNLTARQMIRQLGKQVRKRIHQLTKPEEWKCPSEGHDKSPSKGRGFLKVVVDQVAQPLAPQSLERRLEKLGNLNTPQSSANTENLTKEGYPIFTSPYPLEASCPSDTYVPQTDSQPDSTLPPKGGSVESVVDEAKEMSAKRTEADVHQTDTNSTLPEPEPSDLESKIATARKLGCNVGICWEREEMFVRIDGALKTVGEFVAMPLEVFKQSVEFCQSGLDLCRLKIEKIKERLKNQRLTRLEQLATLG